MRSTRRLHKTPERKVAYMQTSRSPPDMGKSPALQDLGPHVELPSGSLPLSEMGETLRRGAHQLNAAGSNPGGGQPILIRWRKIFFTSAGLVMTASTRIFEKQRGQTNGLSLFAAQTAAAYEIDLVDFSDEPGPVSRRFWRNGCRPRGGAAGRFGHSAGGRLRRGTLVLRSVCLPPPCRGMTDHMIPQGPLPALGRATAPPATG